MKLKTIKQIKSLSNKRVLLRLDLNVCLTDKSDANCQDSWRLLKVVPTINYLASRGAKIIIVAHLGRPNGKQVRSLTLKPIAGYLAKLCGRQIEFCNKKITACVPLTEKLLPGQVMMLENIRFYQAEQDNGKLFSRQLARLADIYVNDAFANIHRVSASMVGVTEYLPSYAGLLLAEEVNQLDKLSKIRKGLVVILGGIKISTKLMLIKKFLRQADSILMGGGLANTLLAAKGFNLTDSIIDDQSLSIAKKLLHRKVHLPSDVIVATSLKSKKYLQVPVDQIPANMKVLDIGFQTVKDYIQILKSAKVIVWNGPLGYFENELFKKSSVLLAQAIVGTKAQTIVGGGETVAMISQAGLRDKFSFVSTGGGAMLAFLQGDSLLALNKLKIK